MWLHREEIQIFPQNYSIPIKERGVEEAFLLEGSKDYVRKELPFILHSDKIIL